MNVLDTFSGIGGFTIGLERAGMRTVAFCENDPYCRSVLAKNWPGIPIYDDIRTLPRIAGIDLISGGVPCQPASLAGKRLGSSDDRWLWPAFLEVVRAHGPKWVVAENPIGIVSLKPHGLDWICGELADAGYETWPTIISANDVGAPHLRQRVWIIAHANKQHGDSARHGTGDVRGEQWETTQLRHDPLTDANRDDLWKQPRRRSGPCGPNPAESRDDGQTRPVADPAPLHDRIHQRTPIARPESESRGSDKSSHVPAAARRRRRKGHSIAKRLCTPEGTLQSEERRGLAYGGRWAVEPSIRRVAHGIPHRSYRLRSLGNAAVPENVQIIGEAIMRATPSGGPGHG